MSKYFEVNSSTGDIELREDKLLLVKEFKALLDPSREGNKDQSLIRKELVYIFSYLDWDSPYFKYLEEDKQQASLEDSELTEEQLEDPIFRAASRKYNEMNNGVIELRLLKAAMSTVEKVIYYLENVDPNERNELDGKPIYKTKDIIMEIKGCKDLIDAINELETKVREGLAQDSGVRGGVELGEYD